MNHLICMALMSFFLSRSASAIITPFSDDVKGWTEFFKLIDTNGKGFITHTDLKRFFEKSEYAGQFDESARKKITSLVGKHSGKLNRNTFIKYMEDKSKQTSTLKAIKDAFPEQSSVLGRDLNKKFKSNGGTGNIFYPDKYYKLQEAAERIDESRNNKTDE
ncbi:uncharacterized protein LOC111049129 isoform X1 [Nilaparvata lugens]|uniref:uncharacterized protein LOC111049129 isoform X1 n=1 Tax=Nilaparvata lugens TaxID=108931 RepID=UPI00193CC727|nr:uncharacterized protein LOC111049129 isoform X1 [Nilaparvata lugens]